MTKFFKLLKETEKYYQKVDFTPLWKIDKNFFKQKHIRILTVNINNKKKWITVQDQIKSPKNLKKAIVSTTIKKNLLPQKIYYCNASFLQCHRVRNRSKIISKSLFINKTTWTFDIDQDILPNPSPKGVCQEADKLIKYGHTQKWKLLYICESGSRGIHTAFQFDIFTYYKTKKPKNPLDREKKCGELSKKLGNELKTAKIFVDQTVLKNPYNVYKVPLTLVFPSKRTCRLINPKDIKNHKLELDPIPNPTTKKKKKKPRHYPTTTTTKKEEHFISSKIVGHTHQILILRFYNRTFNEKWFSEQPMKKFKLPNCYVFQKKRNTYVLCTKAFNIKQLAKIFKLCKPNNILMFTTYAETLVPIDATHTKTLESDFFTNSHTIASKPHQNWLESKLISVFPHQHQVGKPIIIQKEAKTKKS